MYVCRLDFSALLAPGKQKCLSRMFKMWSLFRTAQSPLFSRGQSIHFEAVLGIFSPYMVPPSTNIFLESSQRDQSAEKPSANPATDINM